MFTISKDRELHRLVEEVEETKREIEGLEKRLEPYQALKNELDLKKKEYAEKEAALKLFFEENFDEAVSIKNRFSLHFMKTTKKVVKEERFIDLVEQVIKQPPEVLIEKKLFKDFTFKKVKELGLQPESYFDEVENRSVVFKISDPTSTEEEDFLEDEFI